MRTNYPLLSEELNDLFQDLYYKLVYLLGYTLNNSEKTYIGVYDTMEQKIQKVTNYIMLLENKNRQIILQSPIGEILIYKKWGPLIVLNEMRRF